MLLLANSTWIKCYIPLLWFVSSHTTKHIFQSTIHIFSLPIVLNCKDVLNLLHNSRYRWLVNFTSLSKVIVLGTPWSFTTTLKNKWATWPSIKGFFACFKMRHFGEPINYHKYEINMSLELVKECRNLCFGMCILLFDRCHIFEQNEWHFSSFLANSICLLTMLVLCPSLYGQQDLLHAVLIVNVFSMKF